MDAGNERAIEVHAALAHKGQHRLYRPDLLIAAAAEASGLCVLHYDTDYDLLRRSRVSRSNGWCPQAASPEMTGSRDKLCFRAQDRARPHV